jgi:hypothetical protein
MSAIVATLVLPVAAFFCWIASLFFGFSLYGVMTFGGALYGPVGLAAWWLVWLVPAATYTVICFKAAE